MPADTAAIIKAIEDGNKHLLLAVATRDRLIDGMGKDITDIKVKQGKMEERQKTVAHDVLQTKKDVAELLEIEKRVTGLETVQKSHAAHRRTGRDILHIWIGWCGIGVGVGSLILQYLHH